MLAYAKEEREATAHGSEPEPTGADARRMSSKTPPPYAHHAARQDAWLAGVVILAAVLLLAVGTALPANPGPPKARAGAAGAAVATPAPVTTTHPAPSPTPTPSGWPVDDTVTFHSRPDLAAPRMSIEAETRAGADLLFVTPRYGGHGEGVMILDADGELVWLHRVPGRSAVGLQPTRYQGAPAVQWWEGVIDRGLGDGEFVIMDETYRELARVRTVAYPTDLHELLITPQDTAYAFAMDVIERDGQLVDDMLVQEIDIATGRLLWEWRASDHVPLDESVEPLPEEGPWDYLHLNSIGLDHDGNLLLSARHTDTVYKVDRQGGQIVWRLGGERSDFELPEEAVFRQQHDARRLADGTLSLFDNATKDPGAAEQPRGLVFRLDEEAGTAELVRELVPPRSINASSQGNLAIGDHGQAIIGWGSANLITGYDGSGAVTFDAAMPPGFSSYRAYRAPWQGRPLDAPYLAVERDESGAPTAWVSWNGSTEVAEWELLAGDDEATLRPVERVAPEGFEAGIAVPTGADVVAVRALDATGAHLATSLPVLVGS
jgi:hypothetical protein